MMPLPGVFASSEGDMEQSVAMSSLMADDCRRSIYPFILYEIPEKYVVSFM
jgi:hypothetical protein